MDEKMTFIERLERAIRRLEGKKHLDLKIVKTKFVEIVGKYSIQLVADRNIAITVIHLDVDREDDVLDRFETVFIPDGYRLVQVES